MAEKCNDAGGASVSSKEISIERLACDLFLHITRAFHLKPEVIPQSNLPKNKYTSKTFIKDISRPVLFNSIIVRDGMKTNCERFQAEAMADDRDDLVIANDALFNLEYESVDRPIYKNVVISLAVSLELTQYLHAKGKRDLLKFMPEIWANLFKNRLHVELEQNGGFKDYISYWEFLKPADALISRFLEKCTPYGRAVSVQFRKDVAVLSLFNDPRNRKKLTDVEGEDGGPIILSDDDDSSIEGDSRIPQPIFVPPELGFPMDPKPDPETGEKSDSSQLSTPGTANYVRRSDRKKLKPKPNQTFLRYMAERRAKMKEEKEKKLNLLAEGVKKLRLLDPDGEGTS